jgi:hypothetical protein
MCRDVADVSLMCRCRVEAETLFSELAKDPTTALPKQSDQISSAIMKVMSLPHIAAHCRTLSHWHTRCLLRDSDWSDGTLDAF